VGEVLVGQLGTMRPTRQHHARPLALAVAVAVAAVVVAALAQATALAGAPAAVTGAPMSLVGRSATVSGTVNPNGTATTYAFQWGPSTQYGLQTPVDRQPAGSDTAAHLVTATLSRLSHGTTYHYRLIAISPAGTSGGADASFRTAGAAPKRKARKATATTRAATKATLQVAQLNGALRTRDATVTYYFEYGLTPLYGTQTRHQTAGATSRTQSVAAALGGLLARRTYHFRLVVHMGDGRVIVGSDRTFFTQVPHRFRPGSLILRGTLSRGRSASTIALAGKLTLPSQVSGQNGCTGRVVLEVRRGRQRVLRQSTTVGADCSFRARLRLAARPPAKRHPIRVLAHFAGNGVLEPATSPPLRLGRA